MFKERLVYLKVFVIMAVELYQNLTGSFIVLKTILLLIFVVLMVETTLFTLKYLALDYIY